MFNRKKAHFQKMIHDLDVAIWESEFRKFTAMNEREVVRRQYDQHQDALSRIKAKLMSGKDEQSEKERDAIEKTLTDLKKQMDAIEATIVGGPPSELLPDGAEGIDNKLKAWATRRELAKSFIKHNC